MTDSPNGSGDFSIGSKVWPGTSKVIEEMGELGQVLGKLIAVAGDTQHWDGDLRKRLIEEIADVYAALHFFQTENLTHKEAYQLFERRDKKVALFREWHAKPTRPVTVPTVTVPKCETCGTEMVLHFWDRPGGPPGNGFRCPKCHSMAATHKTVTHVLHEGQPLCGFMAGHTPKDWPVGHKWVSIRDVILVSGLASLPHYDGCEPCGECAERAPALFRAVAPTPR